LKTDPLRNENYTLNENSRKPRRFGGAFLLNNLSSELAYLYCGMTFVPTEYSKQRKEKEEVHMKHILSLIIFAALAASAYSQSLRVTFNGNKDFQLKVDGKTYSSNNYSNNDVVINNLSGDHTIGIYKLNKRGKSRKIYTSNLSLAQDREIHLTVNNNGSISREETSANAAYGYRTPMSATSFDNVYQKVNNQWGQSAKMTEARNIFSAGDNYFSVYQARKIISLLNSESDRLELSKLAYDNITDPNNFNQLYDLLYSQASRNELDYYVKNYNYNEPSGSYRVAMNSTSFNQLYRNISNQWSITARMTAAENAFNTTTNYFTVAQARQVISLLNDENSRLRLAKLSIDNIVDPDNLSQLYDLFYYQSSKDELDAYIRSSGYATDNYSYHTAMSDDAFNTIYQNIKRQWWPGSKMSTAVESFNTPSNYFTTAQAKQIVELVSAESNRVELAKLAFDNIVDPENFRQIYDLFSSQSSKDEVDEYIKVKYNYKY
jgi:hypothetical protein